jgi:branched-chain amino acid transport system substrate-binding protein
MEEVRQTVAQLELARLSRCKRDTFKIDADRRSIWKNFALAFRPACGSIAEGGSSSRVGSLARRTRENAMGWRWSSRDLANLNWAVGLAVIVATSLCIQAEAQNKKYGPGVQDDEIVIGQTGPYSGPVSAASVQNKAEAAYFKKLNDEGGVNQRKIKLISLDDGYMPPKTLEQTRRLVESEQVLGIFGSVGTPTNVVIQRYLNQRKVPHLLITTGDSKFNDPHNYPWTLAFYPQIKDEAGVLARYVAQTRPNAKVAILYQNDDLGKEYLAGFRDALGAEASRVIVATASFEISDATVDSQVIALKSSGADVFFNASTPKFTAQAIRKAYDIGWHPSIHMVIGFSTSIGATLKPAGLDKATGVMSVAMYKSALDPTWKDDRGMLDYVAFVRSGYPEGDPDDFLLAEGYTIAQLTALILQRCGDELTRENVLKQATSLTDIQMPMLLPGIKVTTTKDDYRAFRQLQLARFDGNRWVPFGGLIAPP